MGKGNCLNRSAGRENNHTVSNNKPTKELNVKFFLLLLLSSLKTASRWIAGVSSHLPWHKMSKTLWRILSVTSKHALCNDSKRHVTLISANHLIINLSVGTVPNAPIMTGTTVTFAQFLDPFQLPLQVLIVLIFFFLVVFHFTWKSNGQA